ncbi:hypothetical protein V5799_003050 [Amblyomma americanum]|uniref:Uncharacterized protein n=1 Tax=Amblyomma americanum TaxID=6943 RepID=A0AAQ4DA34_AMBAM
MTECITTDSWTRRMLDEIHEESAAFQDWGHTIRGRLVLAMGSEGSEDSEDLPLIDVNPLHGSSAAPCLLPRCKTRGAASLWSQVRFPLLLLNLVVCVVGVTLSVLSALLLLRSLGAREDAEVLRRGELGALLMSHLELALLTAGLLLSAVSCCGCVGALRENTCLLRAYSFALLALIVASALLGTLVLFMPGEYWQWTNVFKHVSEERKGCLCAKSD